jgi:plastocyanin
VRTTYRIRAFRAAILLGAAFAVTGIAANGQQGPVTIQVEVKPGTAEKQAKAVKATDASDVVVWLKPLDEAGKTAADAEVPAKKLQVVQRNKSFQPHLIVVRVGSMIDFPNRDPFFHNVFSQFDGKRFDLGLYEAGVTNSVRFDRVGVSFLFCNIHPEMSAVVVAVDTPFYGISDRAGRVTITNVPDGRYELRFWYERSLPESLKSLTRTVAITGGNRELGRIGIPENPNFSTAHKNKYGQEYTPPPTSTYSHP